MRHTLSIAIAITVSVTLAVVGATAVRRRQTPGAVPLAVFAFGLASVPAVVSLGHFDADSSQFAFGVLGLLWRVLAVVWLWFALEYTGRGPTVTWRGAGLGVVAALAPQIVATILASLGLYNPDGISAFLLTVGWNVMFVPYILGLFLIRQSGSAYDDRPVERTALLVVGGGVAIILFLVGAFRSAADATRWWVLLAALGTVAGALLVATRGGALEEPPSAGHFARELALDEMTEAAVVLDQQGHVLDANRVAEETFAFDRASALGRPADSVLGFDPATGSDPDGADPIGIETTDGTRQFEVTDTAIRDDARTTAGVIYLFRDVTERLTDEQRLTVLNRVLRHNLRNDLDAIRAFAERIERDPADDDGVAERIHDIAAELAATGTTVAETERLFSRGRPAEDRVEAAAVLQSVAEAVEDEHDGTVTTSTPSGSVHLRTDRELLEGALREVVENGLEHTDESGPTVEAAVETTDRGVAFVVRDDGPGIPAQERAVLLDGDESPLRHGTGIGLWFVRWAVTRLGGELSFGDRDAGGSVVTIRLPNRGDGEQRTLDTH